MRSLTQHNLVTTQAQDINRLFTAVYLVSAECLDSLEWPLKSASPHVVVNQVYWFRLSCGEPARLVWAELLRTLRCCEPTRLF